MYLFTSWLVGTKILKHIFSAGPELRDGPIWPTYHEIDFLKKTGNMIFIYFLASFIVHKFFKNL